MIELTSMLRTESFWAAMVFGFTIFQYSKTKEKELQAEKLHALEKKVENDLRLKAEFRQTWTKLVSFPGDVESIFREEISKIKEEKVRICIFQVIDILHDVHYTYEQRKESLENSLWKNTFWYVFNAEEMKAFITALNKYQKKQHFSKSFIKYVNFIIKQNQVRSKKGG